MKKSILFLAAFAALVSCTKENPVDENPVLDTPVVENQSITFEATAPSTTSDEATKTTLVEGGLVDRDPVHWVKGDAVKVMFVPINGQENQSVWPGQAYDGASGIMTATFDSETSASALFHTDSWDWGVGSEYMGVGIAVYPSSVETYSHRNDDYYNGNAPTVISYNLPSNQTAVENSFQNGVLFSYAGIANVEEFAANQSKLNFKNACALIKVTLPSNAADIVSLTVESSNATLSGKHKVNNYSGTSYYAQYYPNYPLVMASDGGVNNVTLSAPAGETLKAGASYYIVTWPGSHSNGLSFTFTNTLGLTNTKQLAQSVELEASKIDRFNFKNSIEFKHVFEVSQESFDIAGAATSGSFTVTSSRDWTAVSDSEWLTISPASGSASVSGATVTFNAPENTSAERTAQITITAGEDTKVITVTQAQFIAELSIERYGSWNILSKEGEFQFVTIKSNTNWTLSCDQDWLTLGTFSGGATAGETVTLTAAKNTSALERTATLSLRDNANTAEKTFTVTQEAGISYYVIKSDVGKATDLQNGKTYMIFFADGTTLQPYCWKVNDEGQVLKASATSEIGKTYSSEHVFMYEYYAEVNDSELNNSNNGYGSKVVGKLKSVYNNAFLKTDLTFGGQSSAYGMMIMFANRWTGEGDNRKDIDLWYRKGNGLGSFAYSETFYWNGSSLAFGDTSKTPRKWFFFEVEKQ